MKLNFFACLILGLLVVPGFDASPAQLNADASVINSFLLMCTLEKPDFDALDKKSTAMRMLVVSDKTTKIPGGSSHENPGISRGKRLNAFLWSTKCPPGKSIVSLWRSSRRYLGQNLSN